MTELTTALFIDAGNTKVKWRLGQVGEVSQCLLNGSGLVDWIQANHASIDRLIVSSVQSRKWDLEIKSLCEQLNLAIWFARSLSNSHGLISAYAQPDHLGVDRWLALLALWNKRQRAFLLVDSGTATTLDLVDANGQHLGGYILPGLELQKRALRQSSEALNDLIRESSGLVDTGLAKDTAEAVDQGSLACLVALIEKLIHQYELSEKDLFFTGGDARKISQAVGLGAIEKELVLQGLLLAWSESQAAKIEANI